ncbi:hypothetical protein JCM10908_003598 [Rhodotorula pacifica]|uniref:uncharacterized protein n=1 Tax=Rhodotorula pacifica TaxID=1495444 RepID=UPI00317D4D39
MPLSQRKVGVLFTKAETPEETEEIVLAYCFSKWQTGGAQNQVLRKLHLLTLYLRAVDLGPKLRENYQAFAIAATLTKSNAGPVILVPSTPLGLEAWNAARRPSKSVLKRVLTSRPKHIEVASLNGSAASSVVNLSSSADEGREQERERTSPPRPPLAGGLSSFLGGRRSRTNTVTALVVAPGAHADAQRLQAGAGDGLGRGLLSAPPNYDGNLARYLAANDENDPHTNSRIYDPELDLLPGYH